MSDMYLIKNNLEITEMGKKRVTIFIRTGAKVGDKRKIGTPDGFVIGTVVEDLKDTIAECEVKIRTGTKTIKPAENYYRVELD